MTCENILFHRCSGYRIQRCVIIKSHDSQTEWFFLPQVEKLTSGAM